MDKSVFFDADIDKHSELCDVCDNTVEHQAFTQIVEGVDGVIEFHHADCFAWVAAGLVEFCHDVEQCRHAVCGCGVLLEVDCCLGGFVAYEVVDGTMAVGCHLLHKWIVLGMDCCVVERIIAVGDA